MRLTSIALRIEAHANGNETLRVSDITDMRHACLKVIDDEQSERRNVRFALLLIDVMARVETGEGVRKASRF